MVALSHKASALLVTSSLDYAYPFAASLSSASSATLEPLHHAPSTALGRTWVFSPDARQNGIPLALVLIAELLAVPPLLLPCPNTHLAYSNNNKDDCAETPVDKCNANPCNCLKHIVGTCHKIEAQTLWDAAVGTARTAQVLESQMIAVIADLTNHKQSDANVRDERVGCPSSRTVGPV